MNIYNVLYGHYDVDKNHKYPKYIKDEKQFCITGCPKFNTTIDVIYNSNFS